MQNYAVRFNNVQNYIFYAEISLILTLMISNLLTRAASKQFYLTRKVVTPVLFQIWTKLPISKKENELDKSGCILLRCCGWVGEVIYGCGATSSDYIVYHVVFSHVFTASATLATHHGSTIYQNQTPPVKQQKNKLIQLCNCEKKILPVSAY